ncbi:MAG: hypothetical protein EXX96DRAFT_582961 [Benjaminiella poitrasii]|nr:MAG: hypothetical protein EXX96DRAFT_582961 [Benjaminiella poitrasii]
MNKETLAKHVIKDFISGLPTSTGSRQQQHQQYELQQQQPASSKHWWHMKREQPSILSKEEQKLLNKVKSRAHFLDRGLTCCCFQIGFDGLVGFVPVVGDFIGLLLALQLVHLCMSANLPNSLVSKMMFNIGFDFVIGLVPVAGDFLDILYKCNTKNAILFENYLLERRRKESLLHQRGEETVYNTTPIV